MYDQIAKRTLLNLTFDHTLKILASSETYVNFSENMFDVPQARKLVFLLQLRVARCCVLRYRGIECKN